MSAESESIELSVIAPCYNEEGNLPELVERAERVFERRRIRGEIVLVNDGSRDGTGAQIDALAARHPCVVSVHHATNLGIPAGWRSGFAHSRGRYVCTIDADLQYQPEAIALLYREMRFSRADLVQGWRSTLERQHDHRYYWSRGLDYLLKLAFAMPEYDVKSGFVLYRREVFEDILGEAGRFHYFQHMITVVAKAKGYSIRQVETLFAERHAGTSFIGGLPLTMMWRTLVDIGRAFAAYRVRTPKDQSLEMALASGNGPAPAHPGSGGGGWLRAPATTRNAPRYLAELRGTQWLPRAELETLQLRRLRRLLAHAADHVGYWRELLQDVGMVADDVRTLDDLRRLPVLSKTTLRDNIFFDLLSDSSDKRKIVKVSTSGNTGEPLGMFIDPLQGDMRWANVMRHREWTGWRPGDAWLRVAAPASSAGGVRERLHAALRGRNLMTTAAIDPEVVRRLDARLRQERVTVLEADAEVVRLLATLRRDPLAGGALRAVVSTGQTLDDDLRALVDRTLGARIFDRYGARELGAVAQECEAGTMHVNAESFIVEVVRDDGCRAEAGERGEVLVTDLTNRCVPLLRYRTGDLAVAVEGSCACGRGLPVIGRITGRPEGAVLAADERRVPVSVFADVLGAYEFAIQRWQVEQAARDRVVVRLRCRSRFTPATERAVRETLSAVLGTGVLLELECSHTILAGEPCAFVPLTPADGGDRSPAHAGASSSLS